MLAGIDHTIAALAVVVVVEALHFGLVAGTEFKEPIQHHQDNQCSNSGIGNGDGHCGSLNPELLQYCPATACALCSGCHPAVAGEEGEEYCAYNSTHGVYSEDTECVVVAKLVVENNRQLQVCGSQDSQDKRAARLYNACSRSNGHETRKDTAHKSKSGRFSLMQSFDDHPRECSSGGCDLRGSEGLRCGKSAGEAASCVETEPTNPE